MCKLGKKIISRRSYCIATLSYFMSLKMTYSVDAKTETQGCVIRSATIGKSVIRRALQSSGNDELDKFCRNESKKLDELFDVKPELLFFDDSNNRNSYAISKIIDDKNGIESDGTVLMGISFATELFHRYYEIESLPLVAVMAHEWGHILQFRYNSLRNQRIVIGELFADRGAGWYLSRTRRFPELQKYRNILEDMYKNTGSMKFDDEQYHGSPLQRSNQLLAAAGLIECESCGYGYTLPPADALSALGIR